MLAASGCSEWSYIPISGKSKEKTVLHLLVPLASERSTMPLQFYFFCPGAGRS
jgi:hypothetical protein